MAPLSRTQRTGLLRAARGGGFTRGLIGGMIVVITDRPTKISFGEMRDSSVRGLLIYCADYRCSHSIAISGDGWPVRY